MTIQFGNTKTSVLTSVDGAANSAQLNATVTGNTVTETTSAGGSFSSIFIDSSNNNIVCVDVGGAGGLANNLSTAGFTDIATRSSSGGTINFDSYGGAANDAVAVQNYLNGRNNETVPSLSQINAGSTHQGGGNCITP